MTRILMAVIAAMALSTSVAHAQARSSAPKPAATAAAPVNLNTATVDQLATIPGVGVKTAERIIEYRQKNGGFKKLEEILEIQRSCPCLLNISYCGAPAAVSRSR